MGFLSVFEDDRQMVNPRKHGGSQNRRWWKMASKTYLHQNPQTVPAPFKNQNGRVGIALRPWNVSVEKQTSMAIRVKDRSCSTSQHLVEPATGPL
jgi:hypothetical protein